MSTTKWNVQDVERTEKPSVYNFIKVFKYIILDIVYADGDKLSVDDPGLFGSGETRSY